MLGARRNLMVLGVLAASLTACGPQLPNVVLVTFDTTRWDHVGFVSGEPSLTPNVDALAARGTVFSSCFASSPLTLPSHTTILTGLEPFHHGVRNNGTYVASSDLTTLAESLHDAGYTTHAVVSSVVLDSRFGLDQGFDAYRDDLSTGRKQSLFMMREITADQTAAKAIGWLDGEDRSQRPFFLWIHFFDPHASYQPPADVAAGFPDDPYSGEIAFADRELGRVLAAVDDAGNLGSTLVVFSADHGESLGEHGEDTHGVFIYDATMRVPLVMAGPGVPRGAEVRGVARSVDIMPTILDLVGLESPAVDGRSLVPEMKEGIASRIAYLESFAPRLNYGWAELRGLRSADLKVVLAPRPEVYDLEADPGEADNLLDVGSSPPQEASAMLEQLVRVRRQDPFSAGGHLEGPLDPETQRALAALGYVRHEIAPPSAPLADPKDRIELLSRLHAAQEQLDAGRYAEAEVALTEVVEEEPNNISALMSLAFVIRERGEFDRAFGLYEEVLRLVPGHAQAAIETARILAARGEVDAAESRLRNFSETQPANPSVRLELGKLLLDADRIAEAADAYRSAQRTDPSSASAALGFAEALRRGGDAKGAREVLVAARTDNPKDAEIVSALADVDVALGDFERALEWRRLVVELDPEDVSGWNNLGAALASSDSYGDAAACFMKAHELAPDRLEITANLGVALVAAGRPSEGLPYLEQVLPHMPDNMFGAMALAQALELTGRPDEAVAAWRRLAVAQPMAALEVARLELERGERRTAEAALAEALARGGDAVRERLETDPALRALRGIDGPPGTSIRAGGGR